MIGWYRPIHTQPTPLSLLGLPISPGYLFDFFVLVLNEMVLALDCPSSRVRVLPSGQSTSTKNKGELDYDVQRYEQGQAALAGP
jgi:hypothetical protein